MDELRNAIGEKVYTLRLDTEHKWTWEECELVAVGNMYSYILWSNAPYLQKVLTNNLFVGRCEVEEEVRKRNKGV